MDGIQGFKALQPFERGDRQSSDFATCEFANIPSLAAMDFFDASLPTDYQMFIVIIHVSNDESEVVLSCHPTPATPNPFSHTSLDHSTLIYFALSSKSFGS